MSFDQQFFKKVLPDVLLLGAGIPESFICSVDSRTLKKGEVFVALKGEHQDGHAFVADAVANGAAGLIIAQDKQECLTSLDLPVRKGLFIACVPNPYDALIKLATAWRTQFTYPVIGITGSLGKTSTKELLAHIMQLQGKKFIASAGTQNTMIGAALNILKMRSDHEVAIFEMGISKRGEMAQLAAMLRPTTALITAIGHSHMEGLGSLVDIAAEKRDIFKFFTEESIGIINGDQPILSTISYRHPIIKFGCKTVNQIQARKIQSNGSQTQFILKLYRERYRIVLPTSHTGRVMNALAAASLAHVLNIPHDIIIKGIQASLVVPGRFERRTIKQSKGLLIDDCANANPESMKTALLAFEKLESKGQKIAVLGDMLELGVTSPFWHRQLGRLLRKVPSLQHILLVGDYVKWTKKTAPVSMTVELVPTWKEAIECLEKRLDRESVVLVKGSRNVGLDKLVDSVTVRE